MTSLIKVQNVTLSYEKEVAVENVSFNIERGDYLCIVGQNGSGKTTLVKALLGLKKVHDGKILFDENFDKSKIGYLPQNPNHQSAFPASVFEVVMSGFAGKKGIFCFYSKAQKKKALENMKYLGISEISNKNFSNLSGGQKQRVLLARALCVAEDLLILDEPDSSLDARFTNEMYELLQKLCNDKKMSIVMVSHDIGSALKYSKSILHIDKSVCFFGKTSDYANSDALKSLFGGEINA